MSNAPRRVAWISDFPAEWLADAPEAIRALPRRHPATWQMVLLDEFEKDPNLQIDVVLLRERIKRSFSFERNRTRFHVLKAPVWLRAASLFWLDTLLIRRLCRKLKPDLIHAWGAEKGAGLIARRLGLPSVMTVQGLFSWYRQVVPSAKYEQFGERLERWSLPRATVVTTESNFAVRYLRERYPNMVIQQAEHVPNRAFLGVRRSPETSPLHFISVGTIGYRKGTDLLFKALDALAVELQFKLTFITSSNPADIERAKIFVTDTLAPRVQFKQHLLPHEVAAELEKPTMLLLPTRADTSPNAVKEAVVAGVPVIASDVGGIPDYVVPGKNGFLFPVGDLQKFCEAVLAARDHPLLGRGQVDSETLTRMRNYLSPERMAANFSKAYDAALRANSSRSRSP